MRTLQPIVLALTAMLALASALGEGCVFSLPDVVSAGLDGGAGGSATTSPSSSALASVAGAGGAASGTATTASTTAAHTSATHASAASTTATSSGLPSVTTCVFGGPLWSCGNDGIAGDPTHLYYCSTSADGSDLPMDLGQCGDGVCVPQSPGTPDYCEGGFSMGETLPDPGPGYWCGGTGTPYGHGTTNHLYYFADGYSTDLGKCANGCAIVSMANAPDYCN